MQQSLDLDKRVENYTKFQNGRLNRLDFSRSFHILSLFSSLFEVGLVGVKRRRVQESKGEHTHINTSL